MQTIHYLILGASIWLLLGILAWAIIRGGKGKEVESEEPLGYVDQDGETIYPYQAWTATEISEWLEENPRRKYEVAEYPDVSWHNASVKGHHQP